MTMTSTMLTRRALIAAGVAAAALGGRAAHAQTALAARWSAVEPLPWTAQEIYCAVAGDHVFVAGGLRARDTGNAESPIEAIDRTAIFDARTGLWGEGPKLPAPRHHPAIAVAGGRVHAIGGYVIAGKGREWVSRTEVWRLAGDGWEPAGALPGPQAEAVSATLGQRIHLVGGRAPAAAANERWADQADIATHRVLDPSSGRWTDAAPLPRARNSAAGAVIDGRLYVVGGRTVGGGNLPDLDRYDPKTDRWDSLAPMPQAAGGLAAAALGGRLVAFGGEYFDDRGGGVLKEAWAYNPGNDTWLALPPMPTPRHGLAAASVGGRVLAIGGATRASAVGTSALVQALTIE